MSFALFTISMHFIDILVYNYKKMTHNIVIIFFFLFYLLVKAIKSKIAICIKIKACKTFRFDNFRLQLA